MQVCVDIGSHIISESDAVVPATMGDVFVTLNTLDIISSDTCNTMKGTVGFRNVAVHNYEDINWDIVFSICTSSLSDFRQFAKEIDSSSR